MNKKEYQKLLRDKRWKERRIEILERDSYKCIKCGSSENLIVHHKFYEEKAPWEYSDEQLETVCKSCHKEHHRINGNSYKKYIQTVSYIADFTCEEDNEQLTGDFNIEFISNEEIVKDTFEEYNNDFIQAINNAVINVYAMSEIQNSGRIKVNIKSKIKDVSITLFMNGYFSKKL